MMMVCDCNAHTHTFTPTIVSTAEISTSRHGGGKRKTDEQTVRQAGRQAESMYRQTDSE